MTKAQHTPNLQHTQKNVVMDECQNNPINASTTATQSPMSAELEAENTRDKSAINASNADQPMLNATGEASNLKSLSDTAVNANAAGSLSQDSSPLTTQKETGANIVKQDCAAGGSINTLSSKDSRKKVSASFATTAIAHEGNTGNARTKASFTPGPWEIYNDPVFVNGTEFKKLVISTPRDEVHDGGFNIAEIHEMETVDIEANARLIAAAPELLEALQLMLEHASDLSLRNGFKADGIIFKQAHAAIQKARGQ